MVGLGLGFSKSIRGDTVRHDFNGLLWECLCQVEMAGVEQQLEEAIRASRLQYLQHMRDRLAADDAAGLAEVNEDVVAARGAGGSFIHGIPRLHNPTGSNECFLGAAVMVFWHAVPVRQKLLGKRGDVCSCRSAARNSTCPTCVLVELMFSLSESAETGDPASVEPLRRALEEAELGRGASGRDFRDGRDGSPQEVITALLEGMCQDDCSGCPRASIFGAPTRLSLTAFCVRGRAGKLSIAGCCVALRLKQAGSN